MSAIEILERACRELSRGNTGVVYGLIRDAIDVLRERETVPEGEDGETEDEALVSFAEYSRRHDKYSETFSDKEANVLIGKDVILNNGERVTIEGKFCDGEDSYLLRVGHCMVSKINNNGLYIVSVC